MMDAAIPRGDIETTIETLIALLDLIDGDPDIELNGDEADANHAEDDFVRHYAEGPGCPIADPDYAVDDQACDPESEDGL